MRELDELVRELDGGSSAVVFVDTTPSLDDALAVCRRIRALPGRHTVCLAPIARGGAEEARAIEAGADVVWDAAVDAAIVRAVVTRTRRGRRSERPAAPRAAARESAELAERRFRALLDNVLDIVAVVDEAGVVAMVNPAIRTILGHVPETVKERLLWDFLHEEDVHFVRQLIEEALTVDGVASPTTVRAWHADGSIVTLELTGQSLVDDPAIAGVLVYARDVSERMWVGNALQESERRFSEVFENMLEGVIQIDERSRSIIQANPAFCHLVGCEREDLFGLPLTELFTEDERGAMNVVLDEHFSGRRRVSDALRIAHRDGGYRYVDIGTSRIELSGVSTVVAVVRDVTVRRDTERSREMFLAVVAHELRTPVAIVRNSTEMLKARFETMSADDRRTLLSVLGEEAERLSRLVSDALDMGAIQAGSLALRPRDVDIGPIVQAVATRVGLQYQTSATTHVEAKATAHVDPLRLEQILTNLLENSWRHAGSSANVEVTVVIEGSFARLTVSDDGPGFPPSLRGKLFDRVLVPNEAPTSGIGIGLWLCRRLVESMGGGIDASLDEERRGARVSFTIPLARTALASARQKLTPAPSA